MDDGSTDDSAAIGSRAGARVLRLTQNLGRGAAREQALTAVDASFVLMCDATLELSPDFLARSLPRFDDPGVAAVFGRVTQVLPRTVADRWRGRHLFKVHVRRAGADRALLATGACVLRAQAVRDVGGFEANLRSNEDADLGRRLLAAGFKVIFDPELEAAVISSNTISEVLERYVRWNTQREMKWSDYRRQVVYSLKVMACEDLRAGDPMAAFISLLSPHVQFWSARRFLREDQLS